MWSESRCNRTNGYSAFVDELSISTKLNWLIDWLELVIVYLHRLIIYNMSSNFLIDLIFRCIEPVAPRKAVNDCNTWFGKRIIILSDCCNEVYKILYLKSTNFKFVSKWREVMFVKSYLVLRQSNSVDSSFFLKSSFPILCMSSFISIGVV